MSAPKTPRSARLQSVGVLLVAAVIVIVVAVILPQSPGPTWTTTVGLAVGLTLLLIGLEVIRERRLSDACDQLLSQLHAPLALARHGELYDRYREFSSSLERIATHDDLVLRQFCQLKLAALAGEVKALARGEVVFTGTETWRTVYEKLLDSLEVKAYLSVAWVRSADYWRDPPGRASMQRNFELVAAGYRIERILILPDVLWPFDQPRPTSEITPWIDEQFQRGVHIYMAREHQLTDEPDLVSDFGIYGNRAAGRQELDERGRTLRFVLDFDPHARRLAHDRWERLLLYATPYREVVDHGGSI